MPEIAFIGALGVAALKSFIDHDIITAAGTYTAEELHQPRVTQRLEQPYYWWIYSVLLFLAAFCLFGLYSFYATAPTVLYGLYSPTLISTLGWASFGLACAYFVLLVWFMGIPGSRTVFHFSFAIRNGLKAGLILVSLSTYGSFMFLYGSLFVLLLLSFLQNGIGNPTFWEAIRNVLFIVSLSATFSTFPFMLNPVIRFFTPAYHSVGGKAIAAAILLFTLPIIVLVLFSYFGVS